jgi:hypothetical protein
MLNAVGHKKSERLLPIAQTTDVETLWTTAERRLGTSMGNFALVYSGSRYPQSEGTLESQQQVFEIRFRGHAGEHLGWEEKEKKWEYMAPIHEATRKGPAEPQEQRSKIPDKFLLGTRNENEEWDFMERIPISVGNVTREFAAE